MYWHGFNTSWRVFIYVTQNTHIGSQMTETPDNILIPCAWERTEATLKSSPRGALRSLPPSKSTHWVVTQFALLDSPNIGWPGMRVDLHSVLVDLNYEPEVGHQRRLTLLFILGGALTLRVAASAIITFKHSSRVKKCHQLSPSVNSCWVCKLW